MGNKNVLFVFTLLFLFATPIIMEYTTLTTVSEELLDLENDFILQFGRYTLNGKVEDLINVLGQTELKINLKELYLGTEAGSILFNGSNEHLMDILSDEVQLEVQIDPQFSTIIDNLGFNPSEFDFVIYLSEQLLDQITVLQITDLNGKQVSLKALAIPKQIPELNIVFMLEELKDPLFLFDGFLTRITIALDLEFDEGLYNLDEISSVENQAFDDLIQLLFMNNIFPDQDTINLVRHLQNEIERSMKTINYSVLGIFGIISPLLLILYFSLIFVELDELSKKKDKLSLLEVRGAIFRQRIMYQLRSMKMMIGIAFIVSVLFPTIIGLVLKFPKSYLIMNAVLLVVIDLIIFLTLFLINYTYMKQLESSNIRINLPRKTLGKIFLVLGGVLGFVSIILHIFNNIIPTEFAILRFEDKELTFLNMYVMYLIGISILIVKIPISKIFIRKDKDYFLIFLKFVRGFNHYLFTLPVLLLILTPTLIAIDANSSIRIMSDERRDQASIGDFEITDYQSSGVDDILEFIGKHNDTIASYGIVLNSRYEVFIYDSNIPHDVQLNIAIIINPGYWVDNTMFYEDQFETNDPSSLYELENINTTITGSILGYNLGDDYQMTLPVNDNGTTRLETYAGKVVDNFNYAIPGVPREATMIFGNRTIDYHGLGDFKVTAFLNYRDTVSEEERYAFVNLLEQNDFDVDRGFVLSDSEYHAHLKEDAKITGITNLLFPVFVIFLSFILISMDNLNLGKVVKLLNEKGWTKKELQRNFLMFSMLFFSIDLMLLSFASIAAVYANLYTNLGNSYYPMPGASEIFFSQYFWIVLVNTVIIHIVYAFKLETNLRRLK